MDKSTRAPLTSKLFSTLRGFGNVSPLSTPTHDSAVERSPATKPTAPNQDYSTPESMETQSEVRTTSDSSQQSTTRDFQCAYPCPIGLLEGPDYCYQLLKAQPLLNYRKAFHLCAVEGDSDMADEVDLRNPQVLQLLRNVSETDGAERRFFVNERDSKLYMEEKKVRVVSLKWSTRFFLNVNETVRPRQYVENVTAACKRPKFCGEYYCNLNDYEFLVPDSVLVIPDTQNRTLAVGESVTIRCNNSETDVVKVQCRQKGYLKPHPTRVACQEDRKLAFLKRQRIRKSCKECFPYGTQRCERVPEGFVCRCRTNWTASFISGTTAGASIIAMTGSLVLLIRGLLALFYQQQGNDPQTFYQNCRCFFVALAGLFAFLFRHPALLQITQIQCMFSSFVMTCSFLFGMAFFALEALTFYECASLTRLNSWTETFWGRNRFYTTPAFRTLTPLIVLTAAVAGTFRGKPTDVASSWSCMGRFEPSTRNFWFPIALAHSCLGLAALAYTLEGRFKRDNMPQFQQAVDEYLKPLPPARREEVEKCQRNHGLTAIGPWLLYTTWLFLALSADWVVSPTNYWAVACALGYSACELAIFALTTPQVYCAVLSTWAKLLTKRISPEAEPVPLRVRRRRQRRQRRQRRRGGRRPRVNRRRPKRKATISSKMGRRLKRRWTTKYKKLREQNKNKTKAQIVTMVFRKRVRHDLYHAKNEACRKRIRRLFDEWWTETYTADRQPDPVLKLKTRVDMYLEERAALMNSLVFLGGDGRGQAAGDQQPKEPEEDRAIPLCYVSTVDDYGNTQIEEVMKTPAELADIPSTSRPQEEVANGGEGGNIPDHENPLAWIQELTDSTFKMAVQNYDYLERMLLTAETDFGANMLRQSSATETLVVSPISVIFALAMVHAGAKGTTKSQILNAIAKGESDSAFQDYYSKLASEIRNAKNVTADIANGFFLNKQFAIDKSYENTITTKYSAKVQSLDFDKSSFQTIDNFISETTRGKIHDMVKADAVAGAFSVIVNAIYFKGKWLTSFEKRSTFKQTFYSSAENSRQIDFMNAYDRHQLYAEDDDVQVLSLPYTDSSFAFIIILPKERFGLAQLRSKLTGSRIQGLLSRLSSARVTYAVPKMKIETDFQLQQALEAMGITQMFTDYADLSGITQEHPLQVSRAAHRALIEVDEEGTTAAAATAFVVFAPAMARPVPKIFRADHPFWFILTKDKNPLFMGQFA
ncbi:hypothetical protein Q1695_004121 [Nippostrongylus brasiliensis]|nr:hypothetical protein Q1695_004121 [Nippostrongylus brasiliensis]